MGIEDVNEGVEWEARRVAAAFGMEEWIEVAAYSPALADFEGRTGSVFIDWSIKRGERNFVALR